MRLLGTGRRPGQRIQRRPSQRRLSRQPISRLPRLNRVLSLRRLQEMGRHRNERKAFVGFASFSAHVRSGERGAPVLVRKVVWVSRVVWL
jgi:hypothetical protein